jgi:DNA-formamidopyrimidine glycosylase
MESVMPEGPEVRNYTDFLDDRLTGKKLSCVEIVSGRYKKHGPFSGYEKIPLNVDIQDVECYGKLIYINFLDEKRTCLMSTLGMSGAWQGKPTKHNRIILRLDDGSCVYYNDIRNFGTLKYVKRHELNAKIDKMGLDFLQYTWDSDKFNHKMNKKPNKTIAEFLMDQSMCAGIGNYLKAEILYECKISPHRLVKDISYNERQNLLSVMTEITRLSYRHGGATISTYRDGNGKEGLYNRRFAVYNQKADLNGNPVIKEQTKDKRTTHWVPNIQK